MKRKRNYKENPGAEPGRVSDAFFYIASLAVPNILLAVLYNRNRISSVLIFEHMLIMAGILAAAGLLLYMLCVWGTGGKEGALLVTGSFWLCFWFYSRIFAIAARIIPAMTDMLLIAILSAVLIAAAVCLRRFKPPFHVIRPAFNVLALGLIGMFIVNIAPAAGHEAALRSARTEVSGMEEGVKPYRIRKEFIVDPQLPRPDIYWFHVDGMMSIETVERFWDTDLDRIRDELSERGFTVNSDAELAAGYTRAAMPALLSPDFYDSYYGALLGRHDGELRDAKEQSIDRELALAGLDFRKDISNSYELFGALTAAGYSITIQDMGGYIPSGVYKNGEDGSRDTFFGTLRDDFYDSDFPQLLSMTVPLSFRDSRSPAGPGRETPMAPGSPDAPGFFWYPVNDAHATYFSLFDQSVNYLDYTAIHVYPAAYESAIEKTLRLTDMVQARDPGAVIVIQSDHGFHAGDTQRFLLEQGYSSGQLRELMYSVFSAVYIPAQYGGLESPIDPLNISRELVNRFAGNNYVNDD